MKSAVASRLTLAELGSSPPPCLNWISKCIYQFLQAEKCVAFCLFFQEQRSILTPSATSGADRWEENREVWIRVDTSTCRQTRCTSEPALRAGMDTSVCLDIVEILSTKKHSWVGPREAIWDIDNEINTEEQTKETAVCTQYDCFNSQRTSPGSKKKRKTHTQAGKALCCTCLGVFRWFFLFYFNSKSEADRDHHNKNVMSELRREICCSIVLFVCFEDQSGSRKHMPFRIQKMP